MSAFPGGGSFSSSQCLRQRGALATCPGVARGTRGTKRGWYRGDLYRGDTSSGKGRREVVGVGLGCMTCLKSSLWATRHWPGVLLVKRDVVITAKIFTAASRCVFDGLRKPSPVRELPHAVFVKQRRTKFRDMQRTRVALDASNSANYAACRAPVAATQLIRMLPGWLAGQSETWRWHF
ncbi:hypothetical protein AK812_SmicGene22953 [Symbiodinium microadriaticum]|uniref:Uncharacterized protein n=1 Tax=Symbiodinium microadriaticum TaxID=2951 RepID=A0A1Q9DII1_SYMMI|nr:hypothetical protein AK812_SmicGene22953 [Symbiodinium microadriaticum]